MASSAPRSPGSSPRRARSAAGRATSSRTARGAGRSASTRPIARTPGRRTSGRRWRKAQRRLMPEPAPRTVRDLRRGQIIAAARAVVAEGGLEALTIAALEERLGFTRGVITYHFRDKDEIVDAVLASAVAEIDAATLAEVGASQDFEAKVEAVIRTKVRGFLERVEATRILVAFWGRIHQDPRARNANAQLYA